MKIRSILALLTLGMVLTGCGNSGVFLASNSTEVQLDNGDYTIVAKNVTGSAESSYFLGASYSWGAATQSFGLVKLDGTSTLYKDAREDFWNKYEEKNGSVEGRKLALVNVQFDSDTKNFGIYTYAKVTMTADVIEFE